MRSGKTVVKSKTEVHLTAIIKPGKTSKNILPNAKTMVNVFENVEN